jgi:hypothetical protein
MSYHTRLKVTRLQDLYLITPNNYERKLTVNVGPPGEILTLFKIFFVPETNCNKLVSYKFKMKFCSILALTKLTI